MALSRINKSYCKLHMDILHRTTIRQTLKFLNELILSGAGFKEEAASHTHTPRRWLQGRSHLSHSHPRGDEEKGTEGPHSIGDHRISGGFPLSPTAAKHDGHPCLCWRRRRRRSRRTLTRTATPPILRTTRAPTSLPDSNAAGESPPTILTIFKRTYNVIKG